MTSKQEQEFATARRHENDASFAALRQQVLGIEDDYRELKSVVVAVDRKMDSGFSAINAKLDEKNKTPWGVIISAMGFILTFCVAIGTLAYLPMRNDTDALKADTVRRYEQLRHDQRNDVEISITRAQRQWGMLK